MLLLISKILSVYISSNYLSAMQAGTAFSVRQLLTALEPKMATPNTGFALIWQMRLWCWVKIGAPSISRPKIMLLSLSWYRRKSLTHKQIDDFELFIWTLTVCNGSSEWDFSSQSPLVMARYPDSFQFSRQNTLHLPGKFSTCIGGDWPPEKYWQARIAPKKGVYSIFKKKKKRGGGLF